MFTNQLFCRRGDRGQSAYGARPPLGFYFLTIIVWVIPEIWHYCSFINAFLTDFLLGLQVKNRQIEGRKLIFGVESKNNTFLIISNS